MTHDQATIDHEIKATILRNKSYPQLSQIPTLPEMRPVADKPQVIKIIKQTMLSLYDTA
jgi:hypothetical protein